MDSDDNAGHENGFRSLHDAALSGCVENNGSSSREWLGIEIDAKSNDGYISLSAAAYHGHLPIVELLLKRGAD